MSKEIKIYNVGVEQNVIKINENQKNKLVDLDLIWFDGNNWLYADCEELNNFLK